MTLLSIVMIRLISLDLKSSKKARDLKIGITEMVFLKKKVSRDFELIF